LQFSLATVPNVNHSKFAGAGSGSGRCGTRGRDRRSIGGGRCRWDHYWLGPKLDQRLGQLVGLTDGSRRALQGLFFGGRRAMGAVGCCAHSVVGRGDLGNVNKREGSSNADRRSNAFKMANFVTFARAVPDRVGEQDACRRTGCQLSYGPIRQR
jgi:hypothetical protein